MDNLLISTSPPAKQMLGLAEAKGQLRVDTGDEDELISRLIDTVGTHLDGPTGVLGRSLITQGWRLTLADFPSRHRWWDRDRWADGFHHHTRMIRLPLPPIQSVETVKYIDPTGVQQTLDPSLWRYSPSLEAVVIVAGQQWPETSREPDAVTIDFTAGYGAAPDNIPAAIRHAALLYLSNYFLNREAVVGVDGRDSSTLMPAGADTLLAPFIVHRF